MIKVAVLGVSKSSNWHKVNLPGVHLELYDINRDMRNFNFDCPVITHAPCAQWSRMRHFANQDKELKDLAYFCLGAVKMCGGIFEHPHGSSFMRNIVGYRNCQLFFQSDFGFSYPKKTLLHFINCKPVSYPLRLSRPVTNLSNCASGELRSLTPLDFNMFLLKSVINCDSLFYD